MAENKLAIKKGFWTDLLVRLIFWLISIFALARFFQIGDELERIDWYFSLLFHIPIVLAVYVNLLILIPKHLQKRQFIPYIFTFMADLGMAVFLHDITFDVLADWIFPDYYFISYLEFWEIAIYIGFYLIITSLVKLSNDWFKAENERQKGELREKERLDEELRALKAQINPHFLFNNMNLLYSLAVRKAKELPDLIIQLSDLLRYVLYQTNSPKVSLESETKMIDDYIALSKKRMREDSMVNWNFSVENKALMIPPLLFLPLVENGFKYGIFAQTDSTNLKLSLDQKSDELVFRTENRMPSYLENKQNEGGVGLSNLRKRLERLYPNAYSLDVSENDGVFEVQMTLKLSSCVV